MEFGSKFSLFESKCVTEEILSTDLTSNSALQFSNTDKRSCLIEILDTAGQEEYSSLREDYYKQSQGVILVYSIIDYESYTNAQLIYNELKTINNQLHCILVGNKLDLDDSRKVIYEDVKKYGQLNGIKCFETSAKNNIGVNNAINELIRMIPRKNNSIKYSIAIVGDGGVGKTAITLRYVRDEFVEEYDPTIEDTFQKIVHLDNLNLPPPPPKIRKSPMKKKKASSGKVFKAEKANTNVVSLNIGNIVEKAPLLLDSDVIVCLECNAYINKYCKYSKDKKSWICNFCNKINAFSGESHYRIPEHECYEYVIKEAPKVSNDDVMVILVVDISGSMCISQNIPKGFGMVTIGNREYSETKKMIEELNRTLPNEEKIDVPNFKQNRYVSRMQSMQCAINMQLEELAKNNPKRKIVLVTFNEEINVIAAGMNIRKNINEKETLNDLEKLLKIGKETIDFKDIKTIKESKDKLSQIVMNISEHGQTALGSAIAVAIGLASQTPNSEIIVCTDGVCNEGLGKMKEEELDFLTHDEKLQIMNDNFIKISKFHQKIFESSKKSELSDVIVHCDDDDDLKNAKDAFYNSEREEYFYKISRIASDNKTTINAIGITDDEEIDIEMMEILVNNTNGELNIINSLELQRKMREILDKEKIAKQVKVKIICDPFFQFVKLNKNDSVKDNCFESYIGAAHDESNITAEYKPNMKSIQHKEKIKTKAAFQSQISYTKIDGAKLLRIYTSEQKVTNVRKDAESVANLAVVGQYALKKSTYWGKMGKVKDARLNLRALQKMSERSISFSPKIEIQKEQQIENYNYLKSARQLDTKLQEIDDDSDSDEDEEYYEKRSMSSRTYSPFLSSKCENMNRKKKSASKTSRTKMISFFNSMEQTSLESLRTPSSRNIVKRKKHLKKYKK